MTNNMEMNVVFFALLLGLSVYPGRVFADAGPSDAGDAPKAESSAAANCCVVLAPVESVFASGALAESSGPPASA